MLSYLCICSFARTVVYRSVALLSSLWSFLSNVLNTIFNVRLKDVLTRLSDKEGGTLGWKVSKSAGKTQVQSMLTSELMKFVLACLQGTSSSPCKWEFWPPATTLPQEICLRDLVKNGQKFTCDVVCFLHVCYSVFASVYLPDLAAVCTLAPVFSRAEEEAAEWWHCPPVGTLAVNGRRAFGEEGQGRRRTPFSRNRWDMQQDARGEDVAATHNKQSPSRCTINVICLYMELWFLVRCVHMTWSLQCKVTQV